MRFALLAFLLLWSSSSWAQQPIIESGGCGAGAFVSNFGYWSVDTLARGCVAVSPSTLGWYSFTNVATNNTTTIKSGAGVLHTITINTRGTTGNTATIFDSVTGSGTKIGTLDTTSAVGTLSYDVNFANGLTIVTASGGNTDMTVSFK